VDIFGNHKKWVLLNVKMGISGTTKEWVWVNLKMGI
jgi:hypothetical protein